jgi:hypothetical protein
LNLSANGQILSLPTGALAGNLTFGWRNNWAIGNQISGATNIRARTRASQTYANAALEVPIMSGDDNGVGTMGASLGLDFLRAGGKWGLVRRAGLSWTPIKNLFLSASHTVNDTSQPQTAPTKPPLSTEVVFDAIGGTNRAIVVLRDSGNVSVPLISSQSEFSANYSVSSSWPLSVSASWSRTSDEGQFDRPDDPSIEVQLRQPTRYIRDAAGRLTQVDLRTRRLAPRVQTQLNVQTNLRIPMGKVPPSTGNAEVDALAGAQSALAIGLGMSWSLKDPNTSIDDRLGQASHNANLRLEWTQKSSSVSVNLDYAGETFSRDTNASLIAFPPTVYSNLEFAMPIIWTIKDRVYFKDTFARVGISNIALSSSSGSGDATRSVLTRQRPLTISLALAKAF